MVSGARNETTTTTTTTQTIGNWNILGALFGGIEVRHKKGETPSAPPSTTTRRNAEEEEEEGNE